MPTLKREFFNRPTRFTHRFGEKDDPFQAEQYFDAPYPTGMKTNSNGAGSFNSKTKGLAVYTEPFSGVDKFRGGKASLSGPLPDGPDSISETVPASSRPRRTQGPLWTPAKKVTR